MIVFSRKSLLLIVILLPLGVVLFQNASTKKGFVKAQQTPTTIPKNLGDSVTTLRKTLTPDEIRQISAAKEDELAIFHRSIGLALRNRWGLWSGSRLAGYFNGIGINHPDDMSGVILTSLWRQLHHQPIYLEKQIRYYQDYWKAARLRSTQEKRRVAELKAKVRGQMLGLKLVTRTAPLIRLARRSSEGLNIRSVVRFRDGLLLTAKITRGSGQIASGNLDFSTPCYFLDLQHRIVHPLRVAEMDDIEGGLVAGMTLYLHGTKVGRTLLLGIREQERFELPLPPGTGWLRLGQDGERLLAVRPHGVYRWMGQMWETLCSTTETLPTTGMPPLKIGGKIYFRDEGMNEDDKRLS